MKNRIRECRKAAGMTIRELADLSGVSPDAVVKWEGGKRNISVTTAECVASALHVSPAYLVGWSDEKGQR